MAAHEPEERGTKYTICIHIRYQILHASDEKQPVPAADDDDEIEDVMENVEEVILHTYAWATVPEMKSTIEKRTGIEPSRQRLFYRGCELRNARTLSSHRIHDGSLLWLQRQDEADLERPVVPYGTGYANRCKTMMSEATSGLLAGHEPERIEEGEGGSYFLTNDDGERVAVFKPADEETGSVNNPKGHSSETLRAGISAGTGHLREVAAYLLDRRGFYGVPPTVRCEIAGGGAFHTAHKDEKCGKMKKVGSLQKYVSSVDVAGNMGCSSFSVREVHKIGILDIRILNNDRNEANILVTQDEYRRYSLVPIDHGLSIPETIEISDIDWIWWRWPQAKQPFDPFTKRIIREMNIDEEMALLQTELGISERALDNLRIAHMVLQTGMESGLNLHEIAGIILRQKSLTAPSILENLCVQAETLAQQSVRQAKYSTRVGARVGGRPANSFKNNENRHSSKKDKVTRTPNFAPLTAPNALLASARSPRGFDDLDDVLGSVSTINNHRTKIKTGNQPVSSSMIMSSPPRSLFFGTQSMSPPPPPTRLLPMVLNRSSTDPPTGSGMRSLSMNTSPESASSRTMFSSQLLGSFGTLSSRPRPVEVHTSSISARAASKSPSSVSASPKSKSKSNGLSWILDGMTPPKKVGDHEKGSSEKSKKPDSVLPPLPVLPVWAAMTLETIDGTMSTSSQTPPLGGRSSEDELVMTKGLFLDDGDSESDVSQSNEDDDDRATFYDLPVEDGGMVLPTVMMTTKMERSVSCVDLHSSSNHSGWRSGLVGMDEGRAFADDSFSVLNASSSAFDVERFSSWNQTRGGSSNSPRSSNDFFTNANDANSSMFISSSRSKSRLEQNTNGIGDIIERLNAETWELKKYFLSRLGDAIKLFCETHARKSGQPDNTIFDTDTAVGHFVWLNEQRKLLEGRNMFQARRRQKEQDKKDEHESMIQSNPLKHGLLYD